VLLSAILERGPDGAPVRSLAVLVDVTEQRRMEGLIEAQSADLRALSTPLIPVSDRVVVMSLVGALDDQRVRQILEMLLAGVSAHRADFAILDVTGVSRADGAVADALRRAAGAVRLLGAQVVVTGIQPVIAQELVDVAVELGGIVTRGTLKDGVAYALGGGRGRRGA
jgi:rsbT co-antagonist protein RsbR